MDDRATITLTHATVSQQGGALRFRTHVSLFALTGILAGSCREAVDDVAPTPTSTPQWTYTPTPATATPTPPCDETVAPSPSPELVPWPSEWPVKACHEDAMTPPSNRLAPGALDPSFGDGGILHLDGRMVLDVAEQPDGKLVYVAWESGYGQLLCRIERNGVVDPTFGSSDGCTETEHDSSHEALELSSGKIYLAENDGEGGLITRYDEDGVVDASFGTNGLARIEPSPGDGPPSIREMRIANDRIYVSVAILGIDKLFQPALFRLHLDGTTDSAFGTEGHVRFARETIHDQLGLLPVPDGRVIASSKYAVFSFREDGSVDPSFGSGRGCVNVDRLISILNGDPEGLWAIGTGMNARRIEPTGVVGDWLPHMSGIGEPASVSISSSGVIVGGGSGGNDSNVKATIARRLPDGSPDVTFSPSGARHYMGNDSFGNGFEVQCDGRYVLGGDLHSSHGFILRVWN